MTFAILMIVSYLIGGIPFGLIIGRIFFGTDIREHGSCNIGATNAYRVLGWKGGVPVFILDLSKGIGPVIAARLLSSGTLHSYPPGMVIVAAGFAAVIGHTVSPFLKFKGGKGVATSLGVAFALSWQGGAAAFIAWCIVLAATRYVSMASIVGTIVGAATITIYSGNNPFYGAFGLFATIYVVIKHIPNIKRLLRGEEHRFGTPKRDNS